MDCNQNGDCNCNTPGLPDVSVHLYSGACGEALLQMVRTDSEGQFVFQALAPGAYGVYPDVPPTCGGFAGNDPTTSISRNILLDPGETIDLVWFGYGIQLEN